MKIGQAIVNIREQHEMTQEEDCLVKITWYGEQGMFVEASVYDREGEHYLSEMEVKKRIRDDQELLLYHADKGRSQETGCLPLSAIYISYFFILLLQAVSVAA